MRTAKAVGMEMLFEPGHTGVAIKQSQNWKIHVHQYTKFALLVLLSQQKLVLCIVPGQQQGIQRTACQRPTLEHKALQFAVLFARDRMRMRGLIAELCYSIQRFGDELIEAHRTTQIVRVDLLVPMGCDVLLEAVPVA